MRARAIIAEVRVSAILQNVNKQTNSVLKDFCWTSFMIVAARNKQRFQNYDAILVNFEVSQSFPQYSRFGFGLQSTLEPKIFCQSPKMISLSKWSKSVSIDFVTNVSHFSFISDVLCGFTKISEALRPKIFGDQIVIHISAMEFISKEFCLPIYEPIFRLFGHVDDPG